MSASFIQDKPLQALKATAVIGVLALGVAGFVGLVPGQELNGLLYIAFSPFILAIVVSVEALLAGYPLARAEEPIARLTARPGYTTIRAIELGVTVVAPGIFYALITQIGGEVSGPGAMGLLFVGLALGLLASIAVLVRTVVE